MAPEAVAAPPTGFVGPAEAEMMYGRARGIMLEGRHAPYAGFWPRFLAAFVDGIVISIFTTPLSFLFGSGFDVQTTEDAAGNITDVSFNYDAGAATLYFVISFILPAIYYTIAISRWGQTLGALALSLKVVHPDGSLVSPGRAFVRWIGALVSSVVFGLGYLWMIWDKRKQTWHDKFAGSVVVKVPRPGEA